MPYDDPDPTDPMTLHGVSVPTGDGNAVVEMASCFIEEYARLGFSEARILQMFRTTGYAGPALARHVLGEENIKRLVADEMAKRGPVVPGRLRMERNAAGLGLPVLESKHDRT
jgi:hypothetical protein